MKKWLLVLVGILSMIRPCQAVIELAGGPPRSFGDRSITRTFRLDVKGPAEVEWRTRILRGIVERGSKQADGPGEVTIELKLPAVRARIELVQEIQVKQGGKVVDSGEFPMELFPQGLAAPKETPAPVLGVIDDSGRLAAFLEKAGWGVVRLTKNLQYREVTIKVVVVASAQPESAAEPMNGLGKFLQNGGTVIFLDQSDGRKNLFDPELQWKLGSRPAAEARLLVKKEHPALLDLKPGDLANWAGSGKVASRTLDWNDWPWQRAWLASPPVEELPVIAEFWNGKGRVILCQCDITERLETEPAAQILLRNLINVARVQPMPSTVSVVRFALRRSADGRVDRVALIRNPAPEQLKDALASLFVLAPDGAELPVDDDLEQIIMAGHPMLLQGDFNGELVGVLNHIMSGLYPDVRRQSAPEFRSQAVTKLPCAPLDYEDRLLWGISDAKLAEALGDAGQFCLPQPAGEIPGYEALTTPPVLSQFQRGPFDVAQGRREQGRTGGKVRIIFCAMPVGDTENKARQKIIDQIVANLADEPKKELSANVK